MAVKKQNPLSSRIKAVGKATTNQSRAPLKKPTNPLAKRLLASSKTNAKTSDSKVSKVKKLAKPTKINPLLSALSQNAKAKTQVKPKTKTTTTSNKSNMSKKTSLKISPDKSSWSISQTNHLKIHNLSLTTRYGDLFTFLSTTYGPLLSLQTTDQSSGSKTADVLFANEADLIKCETQLHGREADGRVLTLERGQPQVVQQQMLYNPYAPPMMQFSPNANNEQLQQQQQQQLLLQAQFQRINHGLVTPPSTCIDERNNKNKNNKNKNLSSDNKNTKERTRDTKGSNGKKEVSLKSRIGRK